jgi:hypothetical protein
VNRLPVPCIRCGDRNADLGHLTCRNCRHIPAPPTPTNTLKLENEDELVDTGFMLDERKQPAMFVFHDGSAVPAPSMKGYFLRRDDPKGQVWRIMVRRKKS